jgi:glycopeptide antibiotics resistance protein
MQPPAEWFSAQVAPLESECRFPRRRSAVHLRLLLLVLLAAATSLGCGQRTPPPRAGFVRAIPWAERGVWLKADTHVHTGFSDGAVTVDEVARRAVENRVDVLAITDHADSNLTAATKDYFDAIETARQKYRELILLAGLEWNVPPWQGREHATVLVPREDEARLLSDFKSQFDDYEKKSSTATGALDALNWLRTQARGDEAKLPVVFYNHPSRKREASAELAVELGQWLTAGPVAVGFEGGPGHQDRQPIGDYRMLATIDRWDPAVQVGDAWDQMLQRGLAVWGALATSDFHSGDPELPDDFWPGEFAETWLFAEERTGRAALAALRSGSFFGVHGHIARKVQLRVFAAGLYRPAIAGEKIEVPAGASVNVDLQMEMPYEDWQHRPSQVDEVELIVVTPQEAKVALTQPPRFNGPALQTVLTVPAGGITIRARGRRVVPDGPDLMFYTNPIQIVTDMRPVAAQAPPGVQSLPTLDPPRRQMPAWIVLALIVGGSIFLSLIDLWRIEIGRRFARHGQTAAPRVARPPPVRKYLLIPLLACLAVAAYGSFVPFRQADQTWPRALESFRELLLQPLDFSSRTDWATNVLLFVPIGFLTTGLLQGSVSGDRRRGLVPPLVVAGCAALSLAIEFGQLWLADRVASQNDIVAESLGSFLGVTAWLVGGSAVTAWLATFHSYHRPQQRLARLLELYLMAVVALALMPLDLTLRPTEVYEKFKAGRINLLPLADLSWTTQSLIPVLEEALLLVPVGALLAVWRWRREGTVRPLGRALFLGVALLLLVEACQLLVFSRFSSISDPITGLVGIAAGWAVARWRLCAQPPATPEARWTSSLVALSIALVYAALVAAVMCLPFERVSSSAELPQRWRQFLSAPILSVLQSGAITNAVEQALRKVLLFGTVGALLGASVRPHPPGSNERQAMLVGTLLLAVALAVGVEFGQLWLPPHVPDWSDVLLALLGSGLGLLAVLAVAVHRPSPEANGR